MESNREKLFRRCIFYPIAKDQTLATGLKYSKNIFFRFLLSSVIYPSEVLSLYFGFPLSNLQI